MKLGSPEDDLTKLLVTSLAEDTGRTPLDVYRTYLSSVFSLTLSTQSIAEMDDHLLTSFFGSHRKAQPRYLDCFKGSDLAKLGECLLGRDWWF